MKTRSYVSHARAAAAADTRDKVIQSAIVFLREKDIARFSLDAVAKTAGVARLTVYNQFGSRRGLLEAVFDEIARAGSISRIPNAMLREDPVEALNAIVDVFCDFWSENDAVGRLHDAGGLDPEFGEAVAARNERRRGVLARIIGRMRLPGSTASARRDAVDLIFTLTSYPVYRSLAATRSDKAVRTIIKAASADAIERIRKVSE